MQILFQKISENMGESVIWKKKYIVTFVAKQPLRVWMNNGLIDITQS